MNTLSTRLHRVQVLVERLNSSLNGWIVSFLIWTVRFLSVQLQHDVGMLGGESFRPTHFHQPGGDTGRPATGAGAAGQRSKRFRLKCLSVVWSDKRANLFLSNRRGRITFLWARSGTETGVKVRPSKKTRSQSQTWGKTQILFKWTLEMWRWDIIEMRGGRERRWLKMKHRLRNLTSFQLVFFFCVCVCNIFCPATWGVWPHFRRLTSWPARRAAAPM